MRCNDALHCLLFSTLLLNATQLKCIHLYALQHIAVQCSVSQHFAVKEIQHVLLLHCCTMVWTKLIGHCLVYALELNWARQLNAYSVNKLYCCNRIQVWTSNLYLPTGNGLAISCTMTDNFRGVSKVKDAEISQQGQGPYLEYLNEYFFCKRRWLVLNYFLLDLE